MPTNTLSVECTAPEIFFLSALLGGRSLIGVDDPFVGWLSADVAASMEQAQQSLSERRFLEILPDGGIRLDETIARVFAVVAHPSSVLLLTGASASSQPIRSTFYIRQPAAMELGLIGVAVAGPHAGAALYRLSVHAGTAPVHRRICSLWNLFQQPATDCPAVAVREATLRNARDHAVRLGATEAEAALVRAGVPAATARPLAETLAGTRVNGAIAAMRQRETIWETGGFAVLGGENGFWRLSNVVRGEEAWAQLQPASAEALSREIEQLLDRFAPPPAAAGDDQKSAARAGNVGAARTATPATATQGDSRREVHA